MTRPAGIAASAIHDSRSRADAGSAAASMAAMLGRRAANRLASRDQNGEDGKPQRPQIASGP